MQFHIPYVLVLEICSSGANSNELQKKSSYEKTGHVCLTIIHYYLVSTRYSGVVRASAMLGHSMGEVQKH